MGNKAYLYGIFIYTSAHLDMEMGWNKNETKADVSVIAGKTLLGTSKVYLSLKPSKGLKIT